MLILMLDPLDLLPFGCNILNCDFFGNVWYRNCLPMRRSVNLVGNLPNRILLVLGMSSIRKKKDCLLGLRGSSAQ